MFRTTTFVKRLLKSHPGVEFSIKEIAEAIVENNPDDWELRLKRQVGRNPEEAKQRLLSEIYNCRYNLMRMNKQIQESTEGPVRLKWLEEA